MHRRWWCRWILLARSFAAKITADYHLNGSVHQSTVRLTVWQYNNKFAVRAILTDPVSTTSNSTSRQMKARGRLGSNDIS